MIRIILITAAICLVVYGLGFYGIYHWFLRQTTCPPLTEPECPECPQCILENRSVNHICQLIPGGQPSPETPEGQPTAGMATPREICEQYIEPKCFGKPPSTRIRYMNPNTGQEQEVVCGDYELRAHFRRNVP